MRCVIKRLHCKVKRVTTNNDTTVNALKFQTLLYFCSQLKVLVIRAGIDKILVSIANREDPDQTAS